MNRTITNTIRFIMDECIPSFIRNSKYFMYPFFYYAYRGKDIKRAMNFKSLVLNFSEQEYIDYYKNLDTISRNRKTDLNASSIRYIHDQLDRSATNLVDIGCGKGYLLKGLAGKGLALTGCDIVKTSDATEYKFVKSNIYNLPFSDGEFDIVICAHTLEHIVEIEKAIAELKRITKEQLIIVVPCQRYFYYTLDEHIHFFPHKEAVTSLIGIKEHTCKKLMGDWVYIGYPNKEST